MIHFLSISFGQALTSTMASAATKKDPKIIELSRGLAHTPQCKEFERMISGMLSVLFEMHRFFRTSI